MTVGYVEVPPYQLAVKPVLVIDDVDKPVIADGAASVVVLVTNPTALVAVIINTQLNPVNELKVAVPAPDVVGVAGDPLIV